MFFKGYKLASPGAFAALVCFFLPWMLLSCSGQPIAELSGMELANGPVISTVMGSQKLDGTPALWLVPAAGILVLVLAYIASKRGGANLLDKVVTFLAGLLPLLYLMSMLVELAGSPEIQEARQQGVELELGMGYWGAMFGLLLVTVGGVMNWFGAKQPRTGSASIQVGAPPPGA